MNLLRGNENTKIQMLNLIYFETVRRGNETAERGNLGPVFHSHLIVNGYFFFKKRINLKHLC